MCGLIIWMCCWCWGVGLNWGLNCGWCRFVRRRRVVRWRWAFRIWRVNRRRGRWGGWVIVYVCFWRFWGCEMCVGCNWLVSVLWCLICVEGCGVWRTSVRRWVWRCLKRRRACRRRRCVDWCFWGVFLVWFLWLYFLC